MRCTVIHSGTYVDYFSLLTCNVLPQKTPLHYAAENGKLNVVILLLELEAQVDGRVDSMWPTWFSTSSPRRFLTTNVVICYYYSQSRRPLSIASFPSPAQLFIVCGESLGMRLLYPFMFKQMHIPTTKICMTLSLKHTQREWCNDGCQFVLILSVTHGLSSDVW